jgi:hypothetical protein
MGLALASCQPPIQQTPEPASTAPLIGRLQYPDRVVDLNVDAFADGPNATAVDPSSVARVMADVDQGVRGTDAARANEAADRPLRLSPVVPRDDFDRRR